jgi:hypothetical protein
MACLYFTANLATILAPDTINDQNENLIFETADEIMELLGQEKLNEANESLPYVAQDPLVIIWDNEVSRNWHVGFFIDENCDGTIRVDHL